ncbi:Scr1 family TA system antitoxin-like transcriptional regulator [Streptomyces sp. NPDC056672]|uniref:Scr1 family TA system antitoxin-like transcriptional regulator n=1 Tax=Streptomyces sp. NPDC056672 TaxID=3345906 RepID=UPI0036834A92
MPFTAGGHPAIDGALKLMAFPDAPTLAYLRCFASGQLVDDPVAVAQYEFAFSLIGASALSPSDSLDLIESMARHYELKSRRTLNLSSVLLCKPEHTEPDPDHSAAPDESHRKEPPSTVSSPTRPPERKKEEHQ